MNEDDVKRWFAEYLDTFAACGRGERDATALLEYYDVPIVFTTDAGRFAMTTEAQVRVVAQQQTDSMRAAQYHHSEVLESQTTILNATSALHRGAFKRVRGDGSEISRLTVTYLVTESPRGLRFSALVVHR